MRLMFALFIFCAVTRAQCNLGSSNGTNCNSPLTVSGSTAAESSLGLTENGAAPPEPASAQYWLTISDGTIRLSANGQPYVLPGMPSNYVLLANGSDTFLQKVSSGSTIYSPALTQIDMKLPKMIRLVISSSSSCETCRIEAQYRDGIGWAPLTSAVNPASPTVFVTAWTFMPRAANGDYLVRLAITNTGTVQASIGFHSAMLQFK
jgi:hypothetical protein